MRQANSTTETMLIGGSGELDSKDTEMTKTQVSPLKKTQSTGKKHNKKVTVIKREMLLGGM